MNCEQIKPLLDEHRRGALPGFKSAWVYQHLGGCTMCQTHLAQLQRQGASPVQDTAAERETAAADGGWRTAEVPAYGRGRRHRRGRPLRFLLAVGLIGALGALGYVAWQAYRERIALAVLAQTPATRLEPVALPQGLKPNLVPNRYYDPGTTLTSAPVIDQAGRSIQFQATPQRQRGVSLSVESMTAEGEQVVARVRFAGRNLQPPGNLYKWVEVLGANETPLPATVKAIQVAQDALTVDIAYTPIGHTGAVRIRIGSLYQEVTHAWRLDLPQPSQQLQDVSLPLSGSPNTLRVTRYGTANNMLTVQLAGPFINGLESAPTLLLQDEAGTRIAAQQQQHVISADGGSALMYQFPVPRNWKLPLRLVGDGPVRTNLGSWMIDATMIK